MPNEVKLDSKCLISACPTSAKYYVYIFLICLFYFIQFWLRWVFVAVRGLSLVVVSGGYSSLRCTGFSCCRARALGTQASVVAARGLSSCGLRAVEYRLSSCGAQAQLLCGMWDLPGPGLKPMSPALAGRFLTTAPPGKSPNIIFFSLLGFHHVSV